MENQAVIQDSVKLRRRGGSFSGPRLRRPDPSAGRDATRIEARVTTSCSKTPRLLRAPVSVVRSVGAALLPTLLLLGCAGEPRWRVQRQVVDASGKPLPGVEFEVTATRNLHGLMVQLGGKARAAFHGVTDANGTFTADHKCRTLTIVVHKPGYLPKKFLFDAAAIDAEKLSATGRIQLLKDQSTPPADDLDKRGDQELLVRFAPGQNVVAVSLLEGAIVDASSPKASLLLQLQPESLKVDAVQNADLSLADWETGLTVESWKQNHQVVPPKVFGKSLTLLCPFHPGSVDVSGAFFLRDTRNEARSYYARVYVSTVTPEQYQLSFNLSKDEFFVGD